MPNATTITVVGNLTDDPELRFTPNGQACANFSVAVNPRTYDRESGEWKDGSPAYHRCTAWRNLAENAAESLRKGVRVIVTGTLSQRHWTDEKTNQPRSAWDITVDAVGPDLTFARATVTKVNTNRAGEVAPDDPWATASRTRPVDSAVHA